MAVLKLVPPRNVQINFEPSPRQYEFWKLLQPNFCPKCGGEIYQELIGYNAQQQPQYKPKCKNCGNTWFPKTILGGGSAGGGKTYLMCVWIAMSCMRFSGIRAAIGRKTLKSIKESTWNTLLNLLRDWGLQEDVNYRVNNLEGKLTFWNGSSILMIEMADIPSDPNFERFGSLEITIAGVEEVSEISAKAVEVLFSRIRWKVHETFMVPRMAMCTNPCTTWVRSRFVQDDEGNPAVLSEDDAYVPFSLFDNPNESFRQIYEAALNSMKDEAQKQRLLYGNWDFIESNDMALYKGFNGEVHLITGLKEKVYRPDRPLITSWDFNVAPYMSCLFFQIDYEKKEIYVLNELLGKPENKENSTPAMGRKLKERLRQDRQIGGLDITGDPSGLQRSTATEAGENNYTILTNIMGKGVLTPKIKLLQKQPPQSTRVDFVNEVFNGYDGWKVMIDLRCRKLTEDFIYQLRNPDGSKDKRKVLDTKTGTKYEKYGHLSDCFDYFMCYYLSESWYKYQNGGDGTVVVTTAPMNEGFSY